MYEIKTNKKPFLPFFTNWQLLFLFSFIAIIFYSCSSSSGSETMQQQPPQALPVLTVTTMPATTFQEFSASLQGSKDIEIRSQVDGYIDKIYVDEGAHVRRGQPLFHIND